MSVNNQVTYASAFKKFLLAAGLANAKGKKSQLETVEESGKKFTKIQTPAGARYIHQSKGRDGVVKFIVNKSPSIHHGATGLGTKRELAKMLVENPDSLKKAFKHTMQVGDLTKPEWHDIRHQLHKALGNEKEAQAELDRFVLNMVGGMSNTRDIGKTFDKETATALILKKAALFPKDRRFGSDPLAALKELDTKSYEKLKTERELDENKTIKELFKKYGESNPQKAKELIEAEIAKDWHHRDGSLVTADLYILLAKSNLALGNKEEALKAVLEANKNFDRSSSMQERSNPDKFLQENFDKAEQIKFWQDSKAELEKAGLGELRFRKLEKLDAYDQQEYIKFGAAQVQKSNDFLELRNWARWFNELDQKNLAIAALKRIHELAKAEQLKDGYTHDMKDEDIDLFKKHGLNNEAFDLALIGHKAHGYGSSTALHWTIKVKELGILTNRLDEAEASLKEANHYDKHHLLEFYIETKQLDKALDAAMNLLRQPLLLDRRGLWFLGQVVQILKAQGKTEKAEAVQKLLDGIVAKRKAIAEERQKNRRYSYQ